MLLSVGGGGTALARAGGQGRCLFSGPSRQGCTCRPRTKGTPISRPPGHCTPGPGPISVTAGESLGGLGPRTPGCRGSGLFCLPPPPPPPPSPSVPPSRQHLGEQVCVLCGPGALHRWGTSAPRAWRPPGPGSRWPHIPLPQSRKCKFLWWGLRPQTKDLKPCGVRSERCIPQIQMFSCPSTVTLCVTVIFLRVSDFCTYDFMHYQKLLLP